MEKTPKKQLLKDCLVISLITGIMLVWAIPGLGFYSDDWDYLARFFFSKDQSITRLYQSIYTPHTQMRPVHLFYFSLLFKLFGLQPLGYHVVNGIVIIAIAVLFYLCLRRISFSRMVSVSIPLVYILLPHYSTTRFWFASFQINLSMLFYFLSLYPGLLSISPSWKKKIGWFTASIMSAMLSGLSYEVVIPFFFLNAFVYWIRGRKNSQKYSFLLILSTVSVVIGLLLFKFRMTTRLEHGPFENGFLAYCLYLANVVRSALKVNYGELGLKLPLIVMNILTHYIHASTLLGGAMVAAVTGLYMGSIKTDDGFKPSRSHFSSFITGGVGLCLLGYSIFFVNNNVSFFETGIGNRIAIAAAIGVTFSFVGGVGWISSWFPARLQNIMFCSMIVFLCVTGFLINTVTASFWKEAYRKEQHVIADIRTHVPKINKNSVILLDEVCPYVGPAIVFESSWDLGAALHLAYHDISLAADVIKPSLVIEKGSVNTKIYNQVQHYRYNKLFIYNEDTDKLYPLKNRENALSYFKTVNPDYKTDCPAGQDGKGVEVF